MSTVPRIALRSTWPQAPDHLRDLGARATGPTPLGDASAYLDVSASAAERMIHGEYTSADAVEDWSVMWGKAVKDAWSAAATARSTTRR